MGLRGGLPEVGDRYRPDGLLTVNESEARILLLGMEALPPRERWLLAWLVDAGGDVGMLFLEYAESAGLDFAGVCSRWRRMGLLRSDYDHTRDLSLYVATDRAMALMHRSGSGVVDLDAWAVSV